MRTGKTFPTLTTERLTLRMLTITDSETLFRLRSDERVNRYLDRDPAKSTADTDAFIKKIHQIIHDKKGLYWAITLKDNPDELIGTSCYFNLNMEKNMAEVGYELSPDQQGKGLMQEAITAVLRYGFDEMQLKAITALTYPANEKSIRLLTRNGFMPDTTYQYVPKEEVGSNSVYVLTV